MSQVIIAGDTSGTITLQAPAVSGSTTLTLPAATGNVLVSTAVSVSVLGTVTNKIAININGTVYYLLASTSGT
jgi:di/tripeptidase